MYAPKLKAPRGHDVLLYAKKRIPRFSTLASLRHLLCEVPLLMGLLPAAEGMQRVSGMDRVTVRAPSELRKMDTRAMADSRVGPTPKFYRGTPHSERRPRGFLL